MKIPPKLTIGGITYNINFHKDVIIAESGNELVARIDFKHSTIDIHEELGEQITDTSFIHEFLHGMDFCMGVLTDDNVVVSESYTEQRAHLLYQIIEQIVDYNLKEADMVENIFIKAQSMEHD
jgi:hypothetical protein